MTYEEQLAYARARLAANPPPPLTQETIDHLRMLGVMSKREKAMEALAHMRAEPQEAQEGARDHRRGAREDAQEVRGESAAATHVGATAHRPVSLRQAQLKLDS